MNYEEESDQDLAISVIYAGDPSLNDSMFYDECLSNHHSRVSVYDRDTADLVKSFDVNNPADWGKLMQDNKISCSWYIDEEGGNEDCWEAHASARWENAQHPTSPGRAISICYLKMMEANNNG